MQMPPRRSRMRRTQTGKRLELSARDIEIFKLLQRYRYLHSTYIHAFVGGASATRFRERLGDLFHEGYLDRPAQQWEFADDRLIEVGMEGTFLKIHTKSEHPAIVHWGFDYLLNKFSNSWNKPPRWHGARKGPVTVSRTIR